MSDELLMTNEEATCFVRDVLGLATTETRLKKDRAEFLDELVRAWLHHIPFQSLKAISVPRPDRHLPSFSEIKQDIFAKLGGLCYDHNLCCYAVIKALGFRISLVTCDVSYEDSHAIAVVHDVTSPGSLHMVDVGSGYPTFHAIPFDFDVQSPEYRDSYLRYRFVRQGELIIRQHHVDTDPRAALWPDRVQDGWYSFIYIHYNQPKDVRYFDAAMTRIYTERLPTPPYLTSPRCMTWPNGRFVCIKDTTLLAESQEGRVQKSYFKSVDEIVEAYTKHFPQFSEETVRVAMTDEWVNLNFSKGLPDQGHA